MFIHYNHIVKQKEETGKNTHTHTATERKRKRRANDDEMRWKLIGSFFLCVYEITRFVHFFSSSHFSCLLRKYICSFCCVDQMTKINKARESKDNRNAFINKSNVARALTLCPRTTKPKQQPNNQHQIFFI